MATEAMAGAEKFRQVEDVACAEVEKRAAQLQRMASPLRYSLECVVGSRMPPSPTMSWCPSASARFAHWRPAPPSTASRSCERGAMDGRRRAAAAS